MQMLNRACVECELLEMDLGMYVLNSSDNVVSHSMQQLEDEGWIALIFPACSTVAP